MTDVKITFNETITKDLLEGAVIVWHRTCEMNATVLIKLPKDKLYKHSNGYEYEYKIFIQRHNEPMYEATYHNGQKRSVINIATDRHHREKRQIIIERDYHKRYNTDNENKTPE